MSWVAVEVKARELLRLAHRVQDLAQDVDASLDRSKTSTRRTAPAFPTRREAPASAAAAQLTRTQSAQRRAELAAAKAELAQLRREQGIEPAAAQLTRTQSAQRRAELAAAQAELAQLRREMGAEPTSQLTRTKSAQQRAELAAAQAELAQLRREKAQEAAEEEVAATRIGAAVRGRRQRQELAEQRAAARRIEAAARGRMERKELRQRQEAARKIEAAARGRRERKRRKRERQASSTIGAAVRGRRQRKRYNHATATPVDKQLQRARQVFATLDADGNGVLSGDELTHLANWVFESFHPGELPLSAAEREDGAAKLLSRLDDNADGVLDFAEFEEWFRRTCDSISKFRQRQGASDSEAEQSEADIDALLAQWMAELDAEPEEEGGLERTESASLLAEAQDLMVTSSRALAELKLQARQIAKRPATKVAVPTAPPAAAVAEAAQQQRSPVVSAEARAAAESALHKAAKSGELSAVCQALDDGAPADATSKKGGTALMAAAQAKHEEVVATLLAVPADPDLQDDTGWTALMFAAWFGAPAIAKRLVSVGADLSLKNQDGRTALELAQICAGFSSAKGHPEIVAMLEAGRQEI